jgi:hypothetical protein
LKTVLNERAKYDFFKDWAINTHYNYSNSEVFLCIHLREYADLWQSMLKSIRNEFAIFIRDELVFSNLLYAINNRGELGYTTNQKANDFRFQILATIMVWPIDFLILWFDEIGVCWECLPR